MRLAQRLGALGVIIVDHTEGSSAENSQPFGMSGDSNPADVFVPSVFLFKKEGELLRQHMKDNGGNVEVRLGAKATSKTSELTCRSLPNLNDLGLRSKLWGGFVSSRRCLLSLPPGLTRDPFLAAV